MALCFHETTFESVNSSLITLDLEYDYGGEVFNNYYQLENLKTFLKEIDIPINVFVEARLLNDQKVAHILQDWYGDINLHCYDHRMNIDGPAEIRKSQNYSMIHLAIILWDTVVRALHNAETILSLMDNGFKLQSSYLVNPLRSNSLNSINREVDNIRDIGFYL